MSEAGVSYSLRVKIRIDSSDMNKAIASTIRLGNTARGAAKSVEMIERAYAKMRGVADGALESVSSNLQGVRNEIRQTASATGAIATGLSAARRESDRLAVSLKRLGRPSGYNVNLNPRAPQGGQRSSGGNFGSGAYIFGGGIASTLGGLAGGFLGGPVGSAVGSMLGGGLGVASSAGGGAVSGALGYMVELGQQAEVTRAGISSLYMSIEHLDARAASQMAKGTFRALSNDAARGVGQISDYTTAYTSMYAPVRQSGGSEDNIRELTKLSLATGYALRGREGLWQAPLDVTQALTGNIGDRTTPIALAALRASGVNADQYRAANPQEQLQMLLEGFRAFTPAIKAMGETFDAQSETLADKMRQFTRGISEPMFERIRLGLVGFNAGLDGLSPQLLQFQGDLGILSAAVGSAAQSIFAAGMGLIKGATSPGASGMWNVAGGAANDLLSQLGMTGGAGGGFEKMAALASGFAAKQLQQSFAAPAIGLLVAQDLFGLNNRSSMAAGRGPRTPSMTMNDSWSIWQGHYTAPDRTYGPENDPAARAQAALVASLDQLREKVGKPLKVQIDDFRIEWGSDRQMADQMRDLTAHVIERTLLAATESSMLANFG